jgi:CheY-like chemotaxis protein
MGNGETILVVEDDDRVRETTQTMLHGLGYRTLGAADAFAGQAMIGTAPGIDLILTDVVMPGGMDGWDLGRVIAESHPHIPVIFCSGYTDNAVLQRAGQDAKIRLLNKPFRRDELADAIAAALAGKKAERNKGVAGSLPPTKADKS